MTFTNIKKRIASNIGYVDSSGDILTEKNITETDIGNWVNDRYLDDLVTSLATQYPEDYEQVGKANFYKTTSTIASISSTTLTIDDAVFTTGMVDDRIYNSTRSQYTTISAYTSTTVVTLDAAQSDWEVGDTLYVLGHEFPLGGNATDARHIRWVGVKYDPDSKYYLTAVQKDQNKLYTTGDETYSPAAPVWYWTTSSVSTVPTTTLGILPEASENVTSGIKMKYVQMPSALSSDSNIPRLPLGSHSVLVTGGTADGWKKLRVLDEADRYERLYQQQKMEMVANYALTRASGPAIIYPTRRLRSMLDRTI